MTVKFRLEEQLTIPIFAFIGQYFITVHHCASHWWISACESHRRYGGNICNATCINSHRNCCLAPSTGASRRRARGARCTAAAIFQMNWQHFVQNKIPWQWWQERRQWGNKIRLVSVPAWLIYLTATYTVDRLWCQREKPVEKTPRGLYSFCGVVLRYVLHGKILQKLWRHLGVFPRGLSLRHHWRSTRYTILLYIKVIMSFCVNLSRY